MQIDTQADIEEVFTYHAPTEEQQKCYTELRNSAKELASTILRVVPPSADRSAAFRLLRECVMTANAAIALKGKY